MLTKDDIRSYDEFFSQVLAALKELGGSGTNQEIYSKVIDLDNITDEKLDVLHNDGPMTVIEYRLRWTQTYLKKDGAIDNVGRGLWAITERGRGFTSSDIDGIKARVNAQYKKDRQEKKFESSASENLDDESLDEVEDEITWNTRLLTVLKQMDPYGFERLSQRLLREYGFVKVTVTSKSNDRGIDGMGVLRMNLVSFQVMFQCKRYSGTVSPSAIRDFRGAMQGRCDKGLIITTGTFTAEARREAVRDGAPTIDLIDGDALCDLLKEKGLGISVKLVEKVEINESFFDSI